MCQPARLGEKERGKKMSRKEPSVVTEVSKKFSGCLHLTDKNKAMKLGVTFSCLHIL